jgi:hypothetical protein
MAAADLPGGVARAVVDEDHLVIGVGEPFERGEIILERIGGVVRAHDHRNARPRLLRRGRERRVGEGARHDVGRRLGATLPIDQAEGPVVHVEAAAPPLVGPGERDGAARAFLERRPNVHGGDRRLPVLALTDAVGARFGQQQRRVTGDVLQPCQVGAQLGFAMQVDVEGADVEEGEIEKLGRREVDVGEQAFRRDLLRRPVQPPQKSLDAKAAVPPHDPRRNLIAERKHQHGRVIAELADLLHDLPPDRVPQPAIVEESDVLRPRQADHHP